MSTITKKINLNTWEKTKSDTHHPDMFTLCQNRPARAPKYVTTRTLGVVQVQHIVLLTTTLCKNRIFIYKWRLSKGDLKLKRMDLIYSYQDVPINNDKIGLQLPRCTH